MQNNQAIELGKKFYGLFILAGDYLKHVILLLFRIQWGLAFYGTGLGKLQNHEKIVKFFTSLGIPLPDLNAWIAGGVECFGGLLILVGFITRPVATLLAFTMVVAYVSVSDDRNAMFNVLNNPDAFIQATPFLFLVTALLLVCFGPGAISIDHLLGKYLFNKKEPTEK